MFTYFVLITIRGEGGGVSCHFNGGCKHYMSAVIASIDSG